MRTKNEIKEMLLHYKNVDNMPKALIELMLKILSSVQYSDDRGLSIVLDVNGLSAETIGTLNDDVSKFLKIALPKDISFSVILTAEKQSAPSMPQTKAQKKKQEKLSFPDIKKIVAISSGKGGVGKSTIAMNLAVALAKQGLKTGLLDADIHGPSQPAMLGINQRAELNEDRQIIPMMAHGVKTMSIGYMLEDQGPIVWRGPMIQRALIQMLRDVDWGELDILLLDMPPGTGDIPLTVAQYVPISGAVVISTPQDIALLDAMKGLEMFEKLSVDIIGIIENMSMFTCPHCGEDTELFGHGGAKTEAKKRGIPFLGEIPLSLEIRKSSDSGKPVENQHMDNFISISKEIRVYLNSI